MFWNGSTAIEGLSGNASGTNRFFSEMALANCWSFRGIVDHPRKSAPRDARLRHDVMLLCSREGSMPEKILDAPYVDWIIRRPEACGSMSEAMQTDAKSEGLFGLSVDCHINCACGHRASVN